MSRFDRVKQWSTFARVWHLYDAKWQNPFQSAKLLTNMLEGKNKPIYHPRNDCGDHVVVINSKHIALLGREWQYRVYFHHTGYPKAYKHAGRINGPLWIPAWQLHDRDPTLILWKACYNNLEGNLRRPKNMARLHIFPEEEIPEDIRACITSVVEPLRPVPKSLEDFSPDEKEDFPRMFELPENYHRS